MSDIEIERSTDYELIDKFLNDPDIYPWVRDRIVGPIMSRPLVEDPANWFIIGEHGGLFFQAILPGIYEAHVFITKKGRGDWARKALHGAVAMLFTGSEAVEIIGKQPKGFLGSMAFWRMAGGRIDFVVEHPAYLFRKKLLPYTAWSLTIQDWVRTSPLLRARGQQVLAKLGELSGIDLSGNEAAERTLGAMTEMALTGHFWKALTIYNRYAALARSVFGVIDRDVPHALRIGNIRLVFEDGDVGVEECRSAELLSAE